MKKIIIIEGPSGAGKDAVIRELVNQYPDKYLKMQSITSRPMRNTESQGNPYFFVTRKEFEQKIATGEVFEYTILDRDNEYRGMSKQLINNILKDGKIPLKDCDWVGIESLRKNYPNMVTAIWLDVPFDEIRNRIRERGGCEADMQKRMEDYNTYTVINKKYCDKIVKNLDLLTCVNEIHSFLEE